MARPSVSNKRKNVKLGILVANVLLILALATTSAVFFKKWHDVAEAQKLTQDQQNEKIIASVNKVYSLPKDEKPTVAIVSDEDKFKQQYQVFTTAKKGDYLLLYEKAALAVLYRPTEKKVVGTATLSVKRTVGVELLGPAAQTDAAEKTLNDKAAGSVKITKATSVGTYPSVIVVDVSGKQTEAAKQIAAFLGGNVGSLPAGEKVADGTEIAVFVATPAP